MGRLKLLVVALIALLLSAVLTLFIFQQVRSRLSAQQGSDSGESIVVAAVRLPLGTRLEQEHLRLAPWPEDAELEGSFSTVQELIGRGVVVPLLQNEPILEGKLAPQGAGAGLSTAIPEGMRAVSVRVDEVVGVAGFVLPGTRVDVIATGSPDGQTATELSKVVLENVEVLAAGQNVERDSSGQPQEVQVVTLLVTPEDAQKLVLASSETRIQLALRNPMDLEQIDPAAFRRASLYSEPSSAPPPIVEEPDQPRRVVRRPPPPPPPKIYEVEVIQGGQRDRVQFEEKKEEDGTR